MTSVSHDSFSTADPYVGRSAPWSPEAEQAVLGAMLLDQDAALRAVEMVDDTVFYREEHRRLFRAMRALIERRSVIDPVTLNDELERRGELAQVGRLRVRGRAGGCGADRRPTWSTTPGSSGTSRSSAG